MSRSFHPQERQRLPSDVGWQRRMRHVVPNLRVTVLHFQLVWIITVDWKIHCPKHTADWPESTSASKSVLSSVINANDQLLRLPHHPGVSLPVPRLNSKPFGGKEMISREREVHRFISHSKYWQSRTEMINKTSGTHNDNYVVVILSLWLFNARGQAGNAFECLIGKSIVFMPRPGSFHPVNPLCLPSTLTSELVSLPSQMFCFVLFCVCFCMMQYLQNIWNQFFSRLIKFIACKHS